MSFVGDGIFREFPMRAHFPRNETLDMDNLSTPTGNRMYSIYRHEINHAHPAGASRVWLKQDLEIGGLSWEPQQNFYIKASDILRL